jgi:siderophore synthetase component
MNHESTRNALRRLVRCLFAEKILDARALMVSPHGHGAWLPLWAQRALLHFEDLRTAPADTCVNHGALSLLTADAPPAPVDTPQQLIDLLRPHFAIRAGDEGVARLKADIDNSIANDALARAHRSAWSAQLAAEIEAGGSRGLIDHLRRHARTHDAAILLEQWGALEGHPFYPTWKTKPGLDAATVERLSPEFGATVGVRVAALRADMAYVERMPHVRSVHDYFATRFPQAWAAWMQTLQARALEPAHWLPLPIHSWHLEHFVEREFAPQVEEGALILGGPDIATRPTMSFRTMLPTAPGAPFVKLPMALWLTSEQRSLQAKSIHMGPRISQVIRRIVADEGGFDGTLDIFAEELGYHYRHAVHQQDAPGRYLSVVFRESARLFERSDGLLPVPVAALFADSPATGRPLVTELIERDGQRAGAATVEAFFRRYARVVVRPVIASYLLYGIGLEAHQQNASVLFDAAGDPRSLLMRDFGDGRTFAPLLEARGMTLQPYVHPGILPTVFRDDIALVRSLVTNACFVCHLHELALLLTTEYALAPRRLWTVLREETQAAFDAVKPRMHDLALWQREHAAFLEKPWPARSLLSMHLLQYADYRLEHGLANPLVP